MTRFEGWSDKLEVEPYVIPPIVNDERDAYEQTLETFGESPDQGIKMSDGDYVEESLADMVDGPQPAVHSPHHLQSGSMAARLWGMIDDLPPPMGPFLSDEC